MQLNFYPFDNITILPSSSDLEHITKKAIGISNENINLLFLEQIKNAFETKADGNPSLADTFIVNHCDDQKRLILNTLDEIREFETLYYETNTDVTFNVAPIIKEHGTSQHKKRKLVNQDTDHDDRQDTASKL